MLAGDVRACWLVILAQVDAQAPRPRLPWPPSRGHIPPHAGWELQRLGHMLRQRAITNSKQQAPCGGLGAPAARPCLRACGRRRQARRHSC